MQCAFLNTFIAETLAADGGSGGVRRVRGFRGIGGRTSGQIWGQVVHDEEVINRAVCIRYMLCVQCKMHDTVFDPYFIVIGGKNNAVTFEFRTIPTIPAVIPAIDICHRHALELNGAVSDIILRIFRFPGRACAIRINPVRHHSDCCAASTTETP